MVCEKCQIPKADAWICVTCQNIFCGRKNQEHTMTHFTQKKHPLFFRISDGELWCYACNAFVDLDERKDGLYQMAALASQHIDRWAQIKVDAGARDTPEPLPHAEEMHAADARSASESGSSPSTRDTYSYSNSLSTSRSVSDEEMASSAEERGARSDSEEMSGSDARSPASSVRDSEESAGSDDGGSAPTFSCAGLTNLGNTCYLNSIVQTLARIPMFGKYFFSLLPFLPRLPILRDAESSEAHAFSHHMFRGTLATLIAALQVPGGDHILPDQFVHAFKTIAPQFRGFEQQDAHEAFLFLLDSISFVLRSVGHWGEVQNVEGFDWAAFAAAAHAPPSLGAHLPLRSLPPSRVSKTQKKTIVEDLFEGFFRFSKRCSHCAHTRDRLERFLDVSLPVDDSSSRRMRARKRRPLRNLIKSYVQPGRDSASDSELSCEHCGESGTVEVSHLFWTLPKVLVLHLQRLSVTLGDKPGRKGRGGPAGEADQALKFRKIMDLIECPLEGLDLSQFVHPDSPHVAHTKLVTNANAQLKQNKRRGQVADSYIASVASKRDRQNLSSGLPVYDLIAVVDHKGHRSSGHYCATIRLSPLPEHEGCENAKWYQFSDNLVSPVEKQHAPGIQRSGERIITPSAYLLFYVQRESNVQSIVREQVISKLSASLRRSVAAPVSRSAPGSPSRRSPTHHFRPSRSALRSQKYDLSQPITSRPNAVRTNPFPFALSGEWLYRLMMFAWPGPVNNAMLFDADGSPMQRILVEPAVNPYMDPPGDTRLMTPDEVALIQELGGSEFFGFQSRPRLHSVNRLETQMPAFVPVSTEMWSFLTTLYGLASPVCAPPDPRKHGHAGPFSVPGSPLSSPLAAQSPSFTESIPVPAAMLVRDLVAVKADMRMVGAAQLEMVRRAEKDQFGPLHAVDKRWFNSWVRFCKVAQSMWAGGAPKLQIYPPGPLTNQALVIEGPAVRPAIVLGQDYVFVKNAVFQLFAHWYGPKGPSVPAPGAELEPELYDIVCSSVSEEGPVLKLARKSTQVSPAAKAQMSPLSDPDEEVVLN
eukprot:gnl/Chilomastix_cuspidata/3092.p1 GENE.gnl/Chilomastix_cuspidata/3092~~gnl/Chilomastix_cuspidata/3092.p1  ORF type:complete len:1093 (+),score=425.45 gnl/Chilomastix_cuspidata/3092:155-3280(+)